MNKTIIGMQVHFITELFDEGLDRSLDLMMENAINTLFLLTHIDYMDSSYWGQLSHNPKRKKIIASGFFYKPHDSYYRNTKIKPIKTKDPQLRDIDGLGEVIKAAKKREIQCYAMIFHRIPFSSQYSDCLMNDILGRPVPNIFCFNNPQVVHFYEGIVKDLMQNYELDGIFLGLFDHCIQLGFRKLTDEMVETMHSIQLETPEAGLVCFCRYCVKLAETKGVNVTDVKEGLSKGVQGGWISKQVERLATAGDVFRFLIRVPEYLEWLQFRVKCSIGVHQRIYQLIKELNPRSVVGLDIYGPDDCWKYGTDFRLLCKYSDWIKPMFYSGTYPAPPLTPERIYAETKKAIEVGIENTCVVPGVEAINQPKEMVRDSIKRAFEAGAKGVILSWDYGLIPLENLEAARKTLKELGVT